MASFQSLWWIRTQPIIGIYEGGVHKLYIGKNRINIDKYEKSKSKSPSGFCWGYSGSGPGATAIAILSEATRDENFADLYYIQFRDEFIASLKQESGFRLSGDAVADWIMKIDY